jgi:hypothetical protein
MLEHGVSLGLAAVNPDLLKIIDRSPLGVALSHERTFAKLCKAIETWQCIGNQAATARR